jgi:hypothetical protein
MFIIDTDLFQDPSARVLDLCVFALAPVTSSCVDCFLYDWDVFRARHDDRHVIGVEGAILIKLVNHVVNSTESSF